jgi:ubiquinone/menaquinone biosynthesis C-methylase UbiE
MDHHDHVNLISKGVTEGGVWADLGSGQGAFTLALAELLGSQGTIYSVDKNGRSLERQQQLLTRRYPATTVYFHQADFRDSMPFLRPLDGILMANSLHFVREKVSLLKQLRSYLQQNGRFLLVEYDTDQGNHWVPYPLSFGTWQEVARTAGFTTTTLLLTHPSSFLGRFFAALSI